MLSVRGYQRQNSELAKTVNGSLPVKIRITNDIFVLTLTVKSTEVIAQFNSEPPWTVEE